LLHPLSDWLFEWHFNNKHDTVGRLYAKLFQIYINSKEGRVVCDFRVRGHKTQECCWNITSISVFCSKSFISFSCSSVLLCYYVRSAQKWTRVMWRGKETKVEVQDGLEHLSGICEYYCTSCTYMMWGSLEWHLRDCNKWMSYVRMYYVRTYVYSAVQRFPDWIFYRLPTNAIAIELRRW
jgi:hypothetical protein